METTPPVETRLVPEITISEPSRLLKWFAGFMFCAACVAAILLARYKLHALLYHVVEFPYYLECTHKLLEPGARLPFNPDGFNSLGFFGAEGVRGIHQSLHLEPVKYGWALMGYILKDPDFLFAFFAVTYFCPILYFATHFKSRDWMDTAFGVLFIVMYCTFPSLANAVTFDLRPYALLTPACALAILAIRLDRPIGERLLFFNLMFFFREEAIFLGVAVILYAAVRADGPLVYRAKTVWPMILSWCAWGGIIAAYFRWTHYPNHFMPADARRFLADHPSAMLYLCITAVLGIVGLGLAWRFRRAILSYRSSLMLLLLLAPTAVMLVGMSNNKTLSSEGRLNLIYGARWAIIDVTAILILLELWGRPWRVEVRRRLLGAVAAVSILFFSLNFTGGQSVSDLVNQCANRVGSARLVWNARDQIPRGAEVLSDYDTLQAFTDYPHVTVLEQMPVDVAAGVDRFYPRNRPALSKLLNARPAYLILSRRNADNLHEILNASVRDKMAVLTRSERYQLLHLKGQNEADVPMADASTKLSRTPDGANGLSR